ncbi:hypothetical protein TNCV_4440331 [Trichonephila clavipes]|nr:hypothetical protein TNCV_4440331 [Trichonephila clavipes]
MVWDCMPSRGVGRLHIVRGTVKSMDYIEILQNKLLRTTRDFLRNQSWIFQDDNAPRHRAKPDGHGYELVSSVRALVPQKFSVEEEMMHVKHVEVKSPHVGVMWKFERGVICSGIVLVT